MNLKKLGTALIVVLALGAMMASSAFATATTQDVLWNVGGTTLTGSEAITSTGSGETTTQIGTTSLVFKWTGVNCISCKIENSGGTAVGSGELEFTGVTIVTPSNCAVSGGTIRTKPLKIKADYMEGTTNYWLFEPVTPSTWATITIVKGTAPCAIAGTYTKTGTLFVKTNNATNVAAVSQTVTSSGAINKTAGGSLSFGGKACELNGTFTFSLAGSNKGKTFTTS